MFLKFCLNILRRAMIISNFLFFENSYIIYIKLILNSFSLKQEINNFIVNNNGTCIYSENEAINIFETFIAKIFDYIAIQKSNNNDLVKEIEILEQFYKK